MLRRLRTALIVLVAAALGAVLGRVAFQARDRLEAGEPLSSIEFGRATLRVQDFVPGLVAAFRVNDAPWSWFHIPSWLAAFAVNFGVGAAGGDLARLRKRAERAAFEMAGLDARDFGLGGEDDEGDQDAEQLYDVSISDAGGTTGPAWSAPPPPPPPATS